MLRMYTDGSCTNNGKASSRGAIGVAYPDFLESSFGEPLPSDVPQTNQTAELNAIYGGLERLKTLTPAGERVVRICTDSEYSINCLTKWVVGWRKKNWKTAEGKDVVHRVVIEKILDSLKDFGGHQFVHVKAHTGAADDDSRWNDVVDRLARKAVDDKRRVGYEDLESKIVRAGAGGPGDSTAEVIAGIPLAIMGGPLSEDALCASIRANLDSLDPKFLKSALISALKKTLNARAYDLEKTKIHKQTAYKLIEKSHLTIEHLDE
jgi:ribonuclease HI